MGKKETKAQAGINFTRMTSDSEEETCMFCLETKRGRRQHLPIEFKGLFVCECIFQSHAECIIKWQIHCGEDDLQCPICRVQIVLPEHILVNRQMIIYQPPAPYDGIKKMMFYFFVYGAIVFFFFGSLSLRV